MVAKRRQRVASQAAPSRTRLGWEPAFLVAVPALALVGSVGTTGQAQAVDLAAVWTGVAGVVAGGLLAWKRRGEGRVSRAGIAWAVLLCWMLLSALTSARGWSAFSGESTSMLGFGTLAALTVTAIAGAAYAPQVRDILWRYGWWILFAEVALGAAQIVGGAVPAGTLANSTYLGEAALLLLPFTVEMSEPSDMRERWLRAGVALFTLAVLAASGSRVAAAVGIAWALWTVLRARTFALRARASVAIGVVVAVALAAYAFARGEAFTLGAGALGERPAIWRLAFEALRLRPALGWGPDGFLAGASRASSVALARAGHTLTLRPGATDPHDLVAWIAVSAGVVGVGLFAWFAVEVVRTWAASEGGATRLSPAVWGVLGCFVVFLTAPSALLVLPLFALVLGVSLGHARRSAGFALPRPAWPALAIVLALISALLGIDASARAAYERYGAGEPPRTAAAAASASRFLRFDAHLAYLASMHAGFAGVGQQPAVDRADLTSARRAASLDSRNAFYALEYARTLEFYGEPAPGVERAYAEVFARYPAFPLARAEYAVFLARSGSIARAREQLAIALLARDADEERDRAIAAARELIGSGAR